MQDLTPVGLSQDGRRLLLVSSTGEEFAVSVDTRLRAAMRGENARPGQLEMKMESALRPRDIQARIRAGESPEDVAAAAKTAVENIMVFATPVLAERAHVAQSALRASVRRRSGESSSAGATLGEAAEIFFGSHTLHDEDVEWDAWRQPDGRWALVATYTLDGRRRAAEFSHDLPGRYVVAENDEARILTGELREPDAKGGAAPSRSMPARRLSSVPSQDELPLGDDAIELVRDRKAADDQAADVAVEEAAAGRGRAPRCPRRAGNRLRRCGLDRARPDHRGAARRRPRSLARRRATRRGSTTARVTPVPAPTSATSRSRRPASASARAARRSRAGTRSCSVAARASDPPSRDGEQPRLLAGNMAPMA